MDFIQQQPILKSLLYSGSYTDFHLFIFILFLLHTFNMLFLVLQTPLIAFVTRFSMRISTELIHFGYVLIRDFFVHSSFAISLILFLPGIIGTYFTNVSFLTLYSTFGILLAILIRQIWDVEGPSIFRRAYQICIVLAFATFIPTFISLL